MDRKGRVGLGRIAGILKGICRYLVAVAVGVALSAAVAAVTAQLGKDGSAVMAAYAEAAPPAAKEKALRKTGSEREGAGKKEARREEAGEGTAGGWKEGRMLAGEALAEDVLALRQARKQRQEGIAQTKEARQEAEKGQAAEKGQEAGKGQAAEKGQEAEKGQAAEKGQEAEASRGAEDGQQAAAGGEARQAASVIRYSQGDYEVLKRIVEAEAGICDTKGRILVANVVINRVRDSGFPDTITGVVYQKSQFSPVSDGSLESCTVTPETVEAVDRALAGEDYSQGALYFMNRRQSKSGNVSWFDKSLTYLFQHDRHEFFK